MNRSSNNNKAKNTRKKASGSPKADEAIKEYRKGATPLGSYSGITNAMSLPGRNFIPEIQKADPPLSCGKMYIAENDLPVQDADDL